MKGQRQHRAKAFAKKSGASQLSQAQAFFQAGESEYRGAANLPMKFKGMSQREAASWKRQYEGYRKEKNRRDARRSRRY